MQAMLARRPGTIIPVSPHTSGAVALLECVGRGVRLGMHPTAVMKPHVHALTDVVLGMDHDNASVRGPVRTLDPPPPPPPPPSTFLSTDSTIPVPLHYAVVLSQTAVPCPLLLVRALAYRANPRPRSPTLRAMRFFCAAQQQALHLLTLALQAVQRGSVRGTFLGADLASTKGASTGPAAPDASCTKGDGAHRATEGDVEKSDVQTRSGVVGTVGGMPMASAGPTRATCADTLAQNVVLGVHKVLSQLACEMLSMDVDEGSDSDSSTDDGDDHEDVERATRDCIGALSLALSQDVVFGVAQAAARFLVASPHPSDWRHTYTTLTLLSACARVCARVWVAATFFFLLTPACVAGELDLSRWLPCSPSPSATGDHDE